MKRAQGLIDTMPVGLLLRAGAVEFAGFFQRTSEPYQTMGPVIHKTSERV
jgi:hypothetical protein